MPRYGSFNDDDLLHLERTAEVVEDGETVAQHIPMQGMRFGGRDESKQHQIVTRIDHLEGRVIEHIRENLIPRIAEHSRISTKTDRQKFLYYQALEFGRRCSCWDQINSGPDKRCPICFGNSFVSGFTKYGCSWHTIDITRPDLVLVNVVPDFDAGKRPVPLTLLPSAVRGYIETSIQLTPNRGLLDRAKVGAYGPKGTTFLPKIRLSTEVDFVDMTSDSLESRLVDGSGRPTTLVMRFELRRASPDVSVPTFTYFHFRYRTLQDITIIADVPDRPQSIELQEHGLLDVFDTIDMIIPSNLSNVQTSDFFIRVRDNRRFKVTRTNQWVPENLLVETAVTARHVNVEESISLVP